MPPNDAAKQTIGKALGRIPSGVYIVTAGAAGFAQAMLASWIQQAGFDPPMLTLAMARDRAVAPLIHQQKHFVVSILGENDGLLMKKYARGVEPGHDPFENVPTILSSSNIPYLANALAFLECQLEAVCRSPGDHDILLARITAGGLLRDGHPFTHVRGNGFHY